MFGQVVKANPEDACTYLEDLENLDPLYPVFLLVRRGNCLFSTKANHAQR